MKYFGLNLKQLRKAKGMNQDELALKLGVRKTTISNYETGYSNPPAHMLNQIADFFGVTLDELCSKVLPSTSLREPGIQPPEENVILVPVYAFFSPNTASQPLYSLPLPSSFLGDGKFFIIKIDGDSMTQAGLTDGSFAVIKEQETVNNGELALVSINGEPSFFCRYYQTNEFLSLTFDSKKSIQPLMISTKEHSVAVVGKVIKVIQSVI